MSGLSAELAEKISAKNRAAKAATWGGATEPQPTNPPPVSALITEHGVGGARPKFGNVKTADGDSRKEVRRFQYLRLIQAAGQISNLIPQVRYPLVPLQRKADGSVERAMTYTCDAQYIENGKLVVEDAKSEPTRKLPAYIHKRKLMLQLYNIEIREV